VAQSSKRSKKAPAKPKTTLNKQSRSKKSTTRQKAPAASAQKPNPPADTTAATAAADPGASIVVTGREGPGASPDKLSAIHSMTAAALVALTRNSSFAAGILESEAESEIESASEARPRPQPASVAHEPLGDGGTEPDSAGAPSTGAPQQPQSHTAARGRRSKSRHRRAEQEANASAASIRSTAPTSESRSEGATAAPDAAKSGATSTGGDARADDTAIGRSRAPGSAIAARPPADAKPDSGRTGKPRRRRRGRGKPSDSRGSPTTPSAAAQVALESADEEEPVGGLDTEESVELIEAEESVELIDTETPKGLIDLERTTGIVDADSVVERIDFEEIEAKPLRARPPAAAAAAQVQVAPAPKETARLTAIKPSAQPTAEHREMLINVSDGDECRIALMCEGRLEELFIERAAATSNVGNIYKGRITNVEPSIQAAFIDFGQPVHGFLHISDLHPKYFAKGKSEPELIGKKTPRRSRPPIQQCLRRGQEIIVQVIKEGIGTKGPTLSSYVSLPGRLLVMMPDMEQLGVSRKIEDAEQRRKLRTALEQLSLPPGLGFIVRTAGVDRTKRELQRDLNYLTRLWKKVVVRIKREPAPATLYKESDLVIRTVRDIYDTSLNRIVVDSATVAARVREFLSIVSPRAQDVVSLYQDTEPMFHRFGIESEIEKLHSKRVPLTCGGSIVIEPTEALVAIDVNSGRFRIPENAEETAYRVNLEAVDEIARQLRLRDLGGLIICDLIDMTQEKHRRSVERRLADALKKHKERAKILRISRFGILEMTRQRQRPSFAKSIYQDCPRCGGSGRVKSTESACLDVMRQIRLASHKSGVVRIDVHVGAAVANDLLNRKRHQLADLERNTNQTIRIHANEDSNIETVQISCMDRRGREVLLTTAPNIDLRLGTDPNRRPPLPPLNRPNNGLRTPAAGFHDKDASRRPSQTPPHGHNNGPQTPAAGSQGKDARRESFSASPNKPNSGPPPSIDDAAGKDASRRPKRRGGRRRRDNARDNR